MLRFESSDRFRLWFDCYDSCPQAQQRLGEAPTTGTYVEAKAASVEATTEKPQFRLSMAPPFRARNSETDGVQGILQSNFVQQATQFFPRGNFVWPS